MRMRWFAVVVLVLSVAGCAGSADEAEEGVPETATQTAPPIVALGTDVEIPTDRAVRGESVRTADGHQAWVTWHEDGTQLALTVSGFGGCALRHTAAQYDEEILLEFEPGPASEICSFELKMSTFAFELAEPVDVNDPPPVVYVFDDGRSQTRTTLNHTAPR